MIEIISRIACEPWALKAETMAALEVLGSRMLAEPAAITPEVLLSAIGVRPLSVMVGQGVVAKAGYSLVGSVAVVPVWGVLDRSPGDVMWGSSRFGTAYEEIEQWIGAARSDGDAGCILLRCDSPGGAARPIDGTAGQLFAAREAGRAAGGKPLYAITDHLNASAMYYLAAQAEKVYTTAGGWTGSIGTRLSTMDLTGLLDRYGVKVNTIKSGAFKDLGSPFKPLSEQDREKLQAEVNLYAEQFMAAVARGRGMSMDRVRAVATGEGFVGQKAVEAGLVDGVVPSLGALVAQLNERHAPASRRPVSTHKAGPAGGSNAMDPKDVKDKAGGTGGDATDTGGGDGVVATLTRADLDKAVSAGLTAERTRVAEIEAAIAPFADIDAVKTLRLEALSPKAGAEPLSVSEVQARVLKLAAANRGPVGAMDVTMGATAWEKEVGGHTAAMIARLHPGIEGKLRKGGETAAEMAAAMGYDKPESCLAALRESRTQATPGGATPASMRLMDTAMRFASVGVGGAGRTRPFARHDPNEVLGAAFGHSSSDFPLLTRDVTQKVLMSYFVETPVIYPKIARIGESRDFKRTDLITMSKLPSLLKIPEGQGPQEATFNERREQIQIFTHGRKMGWTRQLMINDDLGALADIIRTWAIVGRRTPDILLITLLTSNAGVGPTMSDGVALFHSTHKNLASSPTALAHDTMEAAVTAMKRQTDFGPGTIPIVVEPKVLLTGSELWAQGKRVTKAVIEQTAAATNAARMNAVADMGIEPINTPLIASATAWYLLADPNLVPLLQVNFLNGQQAPTVTPVGNGSILGEEYEIIFDVGVQAVNHEAGYRNAGS